MIAVTVRSAMSIAEALGGRSIKVELDADVNADVSRLFVQLSQTYGDAFSDHVFRKDGAVKDGYFSVLLNGRNIFAYDGFGCTLKEGDDILILPAISGG